MSARTGSTTGRAASRGFAPTRRRRARRSSGSPTTSSGSRTRRACCTWSCRTRSRISAVGNPVDVVILSWPWGAYLGEEGLKNGITAKISSWERIGLNVIPHVAKATGVYLNSMLAVTEANRAGYDEAILLTADGYVADGSGESIFAVKDGVLYTPDLSTSILPGITRDTVIQIAQDIGYRVVEKSLIRSDLY